MSVKWKVFGFTRTWAKKKGRRVGSTWTEDDGPNGTWTVKCSGTGFECDDVRDARGHYDFPSARRAMQVADQHIKEFHR